MIRSLYMYALESSSWPRTSGDDPFAGFRHAIIRLLAPHERG